VKAGLLPEPTGQAVYALIRHVGLLGRLCYGPGHDAGETWVATEDWLGKPLTLEPEGAPELARRYLAAYGPASARDFATWSGLPVAAARAAVSAVATREFLVEDETLAAVADLSGSSDVRLLGEFDPYLLGYKDRRYALADEHRKQIHPGGGMLKPAVVQAGRVIGSWRHDRAEVDLFAPAAAERPGLAAELADLARFRN
jgi:hypothetical protein